MSRAKLIIVTATLFQSAWLFLVVGRYGFFPIAFGFFSLVGLAACMVRHQYFATRPWSGIGLGAISGYVASCVGAFIAEFLLRGGEVFVRPYPIQNLYWFPLISMGWIFGIVIALACASDSTKRRDSSERRDRA